MTSIWLAAMSALVGRDVLPTWRARRMPPVSTRQMVDRLGRDHQMGIYDGKGRRIGPTWSRYPAGSGLLVTTTTDFAKAGLRSGFRSCPHRVLHDTMRGRLPGSPLRTDAPRSRGYAREYCQ